MPEFDVVIIGAGITGLAAGYHLKHEKPGLKIAIIDKNRSFAQGNTAKSAAGYRDLFTSRINRKISGSSIAFYKHLQQDLKIDLGMHLNGYLFLMDSRRLDQDAVRTFISEGRAEIVGEGSLKDMGYVTRPSSDEKHLLNLSDIDGALLGYNCGIIEPDRICSYYEKELRKTDVSFFYNTEVKNLKFEPQTRMNYPGEPFLWQNMEMRNLETSTGSFRAETTIVCADIWTTALLNSAGIDSHVRGKKRQVFRITGEPASALMSHALRPDQEVMPFTIFPSHGIVMRPEPGSSSVWISVADDYNRPFEEEEDPKPEPEFYENSLFPVIRSYLPQFSSCRVSSMWAGHYSYNTIDKTHYVFREGNIIVATGSSGSGIMKADAIGRIVSSLYADRKITRLYDGSFVKTSDMGVENRKVPPEHMVI
ncbi:MAG: FAD-binding oxidoreductase [Candidatus Thermoplasmatota archaeon]|nr:FAD-binding oxidoreductase [Candidatus Thermoplasmatota archaeon]